MHQGSGYMEDIKPMLVESKVGGHGRDSFKDILTDNPADTLNQLVCDAASDKILFCQELNEEPLSDLTSLNSGSDPVYLSIIRLCFWDRKLQEIEHEEIKEVTSLFYKRYWSESKWLLLRLFLTSVKMG